MPNNASFLYLYSYINVSKTCVFCFFVAINYSLFYSIIINTGIKYKYNPTTKTLT